MSSTVLPIALQPKSFIEAFIETSNVTFGQRIDSIEDSGPKLEQPTTSVRGKVSMTKVMVVIKMITSVD